MRLLADELGLRPTKQRGQNFVIDPNTVRRIVRVSGITAEDVVVEVGPGLGSLTLALLEPAARVVAVEVDPVLARALPAGDRDALVDLDGGTAVQAVVLREQQGGPHRDVVGQVGDERGRRRAWQRRDAQRVRLHHQERVRAVRKPFGHRGGKALSEHRVDLDGGDPGDLQEAEGQRSQSRPDLEDDVVRADLGGRDDASHRVGVDDEVLAAVLRRPKLELGGEPTHVGRAEQGGHGASLGPH